MLNQTILPDTLNAISLQESEDGAALSDFQDGQTAAHVGLSLAPANLSARQAKAMGLLMSGTYGPLPIGSSLRVDLSPYLGSRLRARLDSRGSTLFSLTWKERLTPAGQSISALRASVRRTSDKDCIGVPTPQSHDSVGGKTQEQIEAMRARGHGVSNLNETVNLASVPTPKTVTGGAESSQRKQELGRTKSGGGDLQAIALLTTVATPRAEDSQCAGAHRGKADTLHSQANLSTVATPSQRDYKDTAGMNETGINPDGSQRTRLDQLPRQAQLADSGVTPNGGTVGMKNTGQLNPDYSRWLMGFPTEWGSCADMVTRLSLNLRRNLSKRRKGSK